MYSSGWLCSLFGGRESEQWRKYFQDGIRNIKVDSMRNHMYSFRSDFPAIMCATICSSDGANWGGRWEGWDTQYQVASPKRAAEGGRRSKGGMPWSGRREDEAAR